MANNQANNSDEIDLGQLFQMIVKGFQKLFKAFLRMFLYLKKNALILLGLIVLGAGIGYALNQIITKKLKTEVIVKPQMESKNYLYDVVNEINANIDAKDTTFFKNIGITIDDFSGFEISIAAVDANRVSTDSEIKYLELLQSFENTDAIGDIVRAELQNKNSFNHRITFYYKNKSAGEDFAKKIMNYVNSNEYFDGLIEIYQNNAASRIELNTELLKQADELIANYSKKMIQSDNSLAGNERIVLDNQERIDITGLFNLKNSLIRDIESKKIELSERTKPIKIINFGKPQEVQKHIFAKSIVLIPLVMLGGFFLFSIIKYLNYRASKIL